MGHFGGFDYMLWVTAAELVMPYGPVRDTAQESEMNVLGSYFLFHDLVDQT
jgi:hypothetical protein